jgi:predicted NUDIX family phosphoesterase
MGKNDEMILVVDRDDLFEGELFAFEGVETKKKMVNYYMRKFSKYREVRRGDAETNEAWKQPIPSVIIKRGEEVFVYKRLSGGGEERLHDQLSLTVGGHMNRINDVRNWNTNLVMNIQRELYEEVSILGPHKLPELVGILNDDTNEVGRVHIGIICVLELQEGVEVEVRETDVLEGYWLRAKDLTKAGLFDALESWSKYIVEADLV